MSGAAASPRWMRRIGGISRRSPTLAAGVFIILGFALMAVLSPWLTPFDPEFAQPRNVLAAPGGDHPMGTDGNGMDVFSRVIAGARWAFGIAIPAVLVGLLAGVPALKLGETGGAALVFDGEPAVSVAALKAAHEEWLPKLMAS